MIERVIRLAVENLPISPMEKLSTFLKMLSRRKYPRPGDGEKYAELFEALRDISYEGRVSVEGGCDDFDADIGPAFKALDEARG